ncbi:trigger factor [Desulfolithobacter dissulfuricans]|uniref:Trigger factor n=1 Tax=Desulfolithobacter dissulfuricans TaxID=2795293 RepID=A0A915U1I9_9BACT|nr:trigger factor [Desulfolithobacter dissulfuricans]BCO08807.1 trigger factor [Desulfolithobacter dissulfuricans]
MDVVVETVSDLTRKLTITLPQEEVQKELDKAYRKLNKEVKLKGFRRGKIPRTVLEKNFKDQVQADVGEQLVQATYFDAVEQEKIDPVVHPDIVKHDFPEDGTFTYVAMVDVRPEFEMKEYKGIEVEKPVTEVSDEEVEAELEELRRKHAVLRSADEDYAIARDDIAIVDFQGFHEGKPMKEVHNEDYSVDVGSGRLGEDFEEKLIGMKKGEKTLYEVDFPPEYPNPVLAGKTVEFKVDVKDVKQRIKPELDDEFAKDVSDEYETLEDLKKGIREELQKKKEEALEGDLDDRIMHKLIELNEFDVPEKLVLYEIEEMIKQTEENLKRAGLTLESAGITREELVEKNREVAVKRVKGDFLLKKIAELEDIKLADEDIERGYQRIADQYNMTVPEVKQFFKRREEILPFLNELLNEKILQFLRDNATFVEPSEDAAAEEGGAQESGDDA